MTPEKQTGSDVPGPSGTPLGTTGTGTSTTAQDAAGSRTGMGAGFDTGAGPQDGRHGMKEQTREKASELAGRAQEGARHAAEQAREKVGGQVSSQKDFAADQLGNIHKVLEQTSNSLREQDQEAFAGYVDQLAGQVEHLTGYLRSHSVADVLSDVERFARREPALFLGGAMLLGLFGARFFKSSSPPPGYEYDDRGYGPEGGYRRGYNRRYGGYERSYGGYDRGFEERGYGGDYGRSGYDRGYDRGGYEPYERGPYERQGAYSPRSQGEPSYAGAGATPGRISGGSESGALMGQTSPGAGPGTTGSTGTSGTRTTDRPTTGSSFGSSPGTNPSNRATPGDSSSDEAL